MLDEARKREKLANMALLATLGLTAAQSPKDFLRTGHIEGPGSALMQRFGQKRREAERNLDHGAISQAARNIKDSGARNKKVKQQKKSLKEFMYLSEMRKEDKVKGKGRSPLYKTTTKKRIEPDETGHLKVRRINRTVLDSPADMGRFKQGMKDPTALGPGIDSGGGRHPHGGGGSGAKKPGILRGKKKVPGEKKPRNKMVDGIAPAEKVANRRANKKAQDRMYRGRRAFEGFSNWRDDYSPLEVESFDLISNKPLEPTEGIGSKMLGEKCWPGYEKKGMKTMFGKRYPNCVKKKTRKEEVELTERAPLTPPPPVPKASGVGTKVPSSSSSRGHGSQYSVPTTNSSRPTQRRAPTTNSSRPTQRRAPLTPPPPVPKEKPTGGVGTTADNTKPGVSKIKVEPYKAKYGDSYDREQLQKLKDTKWYPGGKKRKPEPGDVYIKRTPGDGLPPVKLDKAGQPIPNQYGVVGYGEEFELDEVNKNGVGGGQSPTSSASTAKPFTRPADGAGRATSTPPAGVPHADDSYKFRSGDVIKPGTVIDGSRNAAQAEREKAAKKREQQSRMNTLNRIIKDNPKKWDFSQKNVDRRMVTGESFELDEVTRREISLTANEDKKFKALLDKARKSKKKPDSNYRPEGGPVRTSKIESDYYARKKKFFSKEELELEEAKEAKSCPSGKYWCYDSKKCKTIPTGWYVGRGGYLEKEEETKKKNGNGNGNGDHDSNGGSDGGGSNGGGNGGGGE